MVRLHRWTDLCNNILRERPTLNVFDNFLIIYQINFNNKIKVTGFQLNNYWLDYYKIYNLYIQLFTKIALQYKSTWQSIIDNNRSKQSYILYKNRLQVQTKKHKNRIMFFFHISVWNSQQFQKLSWCKL